MNPEVKITVFGLSLRPSYVAEVAQILEDLPPAPRVISKHPKR
jgi:hypothetical protein